MSRKKKIFIGVGVVVVLALLVVIGTRKKSANAMEVQTQKVAKGQIVQKVNATGEVKPAVEVIISANVSGEIMELGVKEGDTVKKGQFLVQLDKERYQAARDRAQSSAQSAEADVKLTHSDLTRTQEMHQKGLASDSQLEAAEAAYEKAQSNLAQTQASLKQAEDDLAKTRIVSPIDGTVIRLPREVGEIALGSTFQKDEIMTIADLSTMEVLVEVDESDVIDVALGDSVEIEIDALPDTTFTGKVTEIAHSAVTQGANTQEQVTNFEVTITMDEREAVLRPGMSAAVSIITDVENNAIVVPIQAVTVRAPKRLKQTRTDTLEQGMQNNPGNQNDPGQPMIPLTTQEERGRSEMDEVVFVVKPDITVEQRKVKTGISSDTHFQVESGLEEGDEIVVGSYKAVSRDLQDGDAVERSSGGTGMGRQPQT